VQFRRTSKNYDLDWHPAPNRQYVVTLSGESEIELELLVGQLEELTVA